MVTALPNKTCWLAAVQEEIQWTTGPPKLQLLRFQGGGGGGGGGSTQSTSDSKSRPQMTLWLKATKTFFFIFFLPAPVSVAQRLTYDLTVHIKHAAGSSDSTGFIWFVRIKKEFDGRITKTQNHQAASEHTRSSACAQMLCESKQAKRKNTANIQRTTHEHANIWNETLQSATTIKTNGSSCIIMFSYLHSIREKNDRQSILRGVKLHYYCTGPNTQMLNQSVEASVVVPQDVGIDSIASVLPQQESLVHLQKNKRRLKNF